MATSSMRILDPPIPSFNARTGKVEGAPFQVLMTINSKGAFLALPKSTELDGSHISVLSPPKKFKKNWVVDITDFITDMSWDSSDDDYYTKLSLTLDNYRGTFNQMPHGTRIEVKVRRPFYNYDGKASGKFYPYITAFVFEKERTGDGSSQTMTIQLYDNLYWLSKNQVHHVFKSDRKHPRGWTATEIIKFLAAQAGIRVGVIHASSKRFGRLELKGSILDCVYAALKKDKSATNRLAKYHVDMRDGKLNVTLENPKPKSVYGITDDYMIETGTMSEVLGKDFATRITVTGVERPPDKTNNHGQKIKVLKESTITVNPKNASYQKAFGIISRTVKVKGNHKRAVLSKMAYTELGKALRPDRTFDITIRGIPDLWPGSRVFVASKYFGVKGFVRVSSVSYSVSGGDFSLRLSLNVDTHTDMTEETIRLYYSKRSIRY